MYVKSLILCFIFLLSCKQVVTTDEFYKKTSSRWNFATKISWENSHYKGLEKILSPKGTYQSIFEIEFVDKNFNKSYDCIQFYIPKKDFDGELSIVPNPKHEDCSKLITSQSYAKIKEIKNFGFEIDSDVLKLKVDEFRFEYKLLNFLKQIKPTLLDSSIIPSTLDGILIASNISYSKQNPLIKDGSICYDIDDECNELLTNKCSDCKGGFFEVIASKCGVKRKRVCGVNKCGEKNQYACFRGYLASGIDPKNYCIADSPVGFCNENLKVVCINNVLMCE
jgi:hypothetical protein